MKNSRNKFKIWSIFYRNQKAIKIHNPLVKIKIKFKQKTIQYIQSFVEQINKFH